MEHTFYAPIRDHIAKSWQAGDYYEAGQGQLLQILMHKQRGPFVDIGAHWGNHSVFLAKAGYGPGHAFEPSPQSYGILGSNVEGLDVEHHRVALSDHHGQCAIQPGPAGNTGMNKIADGKGVIVSTLDSYKLSPTFIKIDAEGCELAILRGAVDTIKRHRPMVSCELLEDEEAIEAMLSGLGYTSILTANYTRTKLFIHDDGPR